MDASWLHDCDSRVSRLSTLHLLKMKAFPLPIPNVLILKLKKLKNHVSILKTDLIFFPHKCQKNIKNIFLNTKPDANYFSKIFNLFIFNFYFSFTQWQQLETTNSLISIN